jgi:glyoxylase-like metal-dependent hydrolase (beta-lactamase superfamily II)
MAEMIPRTIAVLGSLAALAGRAGAQQHFTVEPLAHGVYAVIRREPLAMANHANTLLIVGDSDVVVVDAQFTRAATLEVLAVLRRLTPRPVSYVINTHWHDDHVAGNQVYRDSFPGVQFIAHANTREDLATLGAANRKGQVSGGPAALAGFDSLLRRGLALDSTPVSPSDRRAMESTLAIARQYLAEAPGFRETLPTITFDDRLTLYRGGRRIEIRWFGRANTRGDAVVWLPAERIVATGDLVVAPIPFAFGSFIAEWATALEGVRALEPTTILPGHGPVMRDDAYLLTLSRMLRAVTEQTRTAAAGGATLAQAKERVTLAEFRRQLAGDDKWLNYIFTRFFQNPAVSRGYAEATKR